VIVSFKIKSGDLWFLSWPIDSGNEKKIEKIYDPEVAYEKDIFDPEFSRVEKILDFREINFDRKKAFFELLNPKFKPVKNRLPEEYKRLGQFENLIVYGKRPLGSFELEKIKASKKFFDDNLPAGQRIYFEKSDLEKFSFGQFSTIDPEEKNEFKINLRGGFKMKVLLDKYLNLEITKTELNWYEGPDDIEMILSDSDGKIICGSISNDDGDITKDQKQSKNSKELFCPNIEKGVYDLNIKPVGEPSNDFIIEDLKINTKKLVFEGEIHPKNPIDLYLQNFETSQLKFYYWIPGLDQTIFFEGENSTESFKLESSDIEKEKIMALLPGKWKMRLPKGGLTISGANFALNEENWFDTGSKKNYALENIGSAPALIKDITIRIK